MITSGTETNIRVVLRTRPTQNFANKNVSLDNMENVNIFIVIHFRSLQLTSPNQKKKD